MLSEYLQVVLSLRRFSVFPAAVIPGKGRGNGPLDSFLCMGNVVIKVTSIMSCTSSPIHATQKMVLGKAKHLTCKTRSKTFIPGFCLLVVSFKMDQERKKKTHLLFTIYLL